MSPFGGATGGIFEIFKNEHIFLKFLFLKNIKKKKRPLCPGKEKRADQPYPSLTTLRNLYILYKHNPLSIIYHISLDMQPVHVTCWCPARVLSRRSGHPIAISAGWYRREIRRSPIATAYCGSRNGHGGAQSYH